MSTPATKPEISYAAKRAAFAQLRNFANRFRDFLALADEVDELAGLEFAREERLRKLDELKTLQSDAQARLDTVTAQANELEATTSKRAKQIETIAREQADNAMAETTQALATANFRLGDLNDTIAAREARLAELQKEIGDVERIAEFKRTMDALKGKV